MRRYVPMDDATYEPTDDPAWWRDVNVCGDWCHHPVHAWHPERRHHLERASWVERHGVPA